MSVAGADPLSEPLTWAELINPQLTSDQQISQFSRRCTHLLETTRAQVTREPPATDVILKRKLASTFLLFANPGPLPRGVEPGRLQRVRLDTFADPALRMLRDRIGLTVPEGDVFIRYYPSKQSLPAELLAAFHREHTRAVTFGGRYIAVLAGTPIEPSELALRRRMEKKILSQIGRAHV